MSLNIWRLIVNGIAIWILLVYNENNSVPLSISTLSLLSLLIIQLLISRLINNFKNKISIRIAKTASPILWILTTILLPITTLLRKIENKYLLKQMTESSNIDNQIPPTLITIDEPVNPPDEQELSMIRGILTMEESIVREVMVPKPDLIAIDCDASIEEAVTIMNQSGHSRILVYEDSIDKVIGTLHARDMLLLFNAKQHQVIIRHLVRPVLYAPDSKKVDDLLRDFQQERIHMAVVVDEYGSTAGLVTLEDIIEEIIGELSDEFEKAESEIDIVDENEIIVDAGIHVETLLEQFSVEVETDGFDTIGGLIYSNLGKMANPGDEVIYKNVKLHVLSVVGRRIKRVKITKINSS
tara:strand:- start:442 stop:1503 length:1062 start_codon:yes stop_codon:yes gene_type:complete